MHDQFNKVIHASSKITVVSGSSIFNFRTMPENKKSDVTLDFNPDRKAGNFTSRLTFKYRGDYYSHRVSRK